MQFKSYTHDGKQNFQQLVQFLSNSLNVTCRTETTQEVTCFPNLLHENVILKYI